MPWRASRRWASAEAAVRHAAAAAIAAALIAGCAGTTAPRVSDEARSVTRERPYLLSPLEGYPLAVAPSREQALREAHTVLVELRQPAAARARAQSLLDATPGLHPAILLVAQAELVEGQWQAARSRLEPVLEELPDYTAAALAFARTSEILEEVPAAYDAYRRLADRSGVARDRAAVLRERAIEIVARRLENALARGHLEAGQADLGLLRYWAPDDRLTWHSARRVAEAAGDPTSELEAVRELRRFEPEDSELRLREADLELEAGDAGRGLRILEEMADAEPANAAVAERLGRARFRWRLQLLPAGSREILRQPELSRGDFAVLLYWLFPSVRYGRVEGGGTIANDVFDHPAREEIVKVVNQGLMQVDRTLHTFQPERPLRRGEALRGLLQLLLQQRSQLACAAGVERRDLGRSSQIVCRVASGCGLTDEEADCLPEAPVSGAEAVEVARRTLEQLGTE